jgi:hypothetical protein
MRLILGWIFILITGCNASYKPFVTEELLSLPQKDNASCNSQAWKHVYNPRRLRILDKCITLSGKIINSKFEKDGDLHLLLQLDPGQQALLSKKNISYQKSCMVLEIVCATTPRKKWAMDECSSYTNPVYIPAVNEHVFVTGSRVVDLHNGWVEIHPIFKIELK